MSDVRQRRSTRLRPSPGGHRPGMSAQKKSSRTAESEVLRAAETGRLRKLDLEQLLRLHKKVRKARAVHIERFRRRWAKKAKRTSGRTAVLRHRAAQFEQALSSVSWAVARGAHRQAEALRMDEVAQARAKKAWRNPDSRARQADRTRQGRAELPAGARR